MKRRNGRGGEQSKGWSSDQNSGSFRDITAIEKDPLAAKNSWVDRHRDLIRSLEAAGHSLTFSVHPDRSATKGADRDAADRLDDAWTGSVTDPRPTCGHFYT